jgi:KipI family sensor histidine kinase inhibitor
VEFVPGCDAILLEFSRISDTQLSRLENDLRQVKPAEPDAAPEHTIPVLYDGPDLEEFAAAKAMRLEDVAAEHSSRVYDVCVIGFSPGFAYLGPLAETLHMPRRKTPRLKVPAGSVGIGGSHTGVYSISSPGGWWLIGSTQTEFFSVTEASGAGSAQAFLLRPGDRVKFEPTAA